MKNDIVMYQKVYKSIRGKIECGLLAYGTKLPSRAQLCREYGVSEKTARYVVELLVEDGLIETSQRKRPTVSYRGSKSGAPRPLHESNTSEANEISQTVILICLPIIINGLKLCKEEDLAVPDAILAKMDPNLDSEFWLLLKHFWRFFIARNENEHILRVVGCLGFSDMQPATESLEIRSNYYAKLKEIIRMAKQCESGTPITPDDLSFIFESICNDNEAFPAYWIPPDSPFRVGTRELVQRFCKSQQLYSSIYWDLLALIAMGRYRPGDPLPSHKDLCKKYGVSSYTTLRAVKTLSEWGVVKTKQGKGTFVAMGLGELRKIRLAPQSAAKYVRKALDNMEFLTLTIEGVAKLAAANVTEEEAFVLFNEIDRLWDGRSLYQYSSFLLLDFISDHIQYQTLHGVYDIVRKNYHLSRVLPKRLHGTKTPIRFEIYNLSMEAASFLTRGDSKHFANKVSDVFQKTKRLFVMECMHQGTWAEAMRVYDGSALWK